MWGKNIKKKFFIYYKEFVIYIIDFVNKFRFFWFFFILVLVILIFIFDLGLNLGILIFDIIL